MLSHTSADLVFSDAKIRALRWDLLDWAVVIDLDVASAPGRPLSYRRAWCVFERLKEFRIQADKARLPIGIWVYNTKRTALGDGDTRFEVSAQLPKSALDKDLVFPSPQSFSIVAAKAIAIISKRPVKPRQHDFLDFKERKSSGSDEAFLEAYIRIGNDRPSIVF
ncbi:MAG: hypothetical protein AAGE61_21525 [Pseudomonadota bacterium]